MKFIESEQQTGFAPGWTGFATKEGFDVLLRNEDGFMRTRLAPAANKSCVGEITEPGTGEVLKLRVTQAKSGDVMLTVGDAKPRVMKRHTKTTEEGTVTWWFAFKNEWPAKAEPVDSFDAMFK